MKHNWAPRINICTIITNALYLRVEHSLVAVHKMWRINCLNLHSSLLGCFSCTPCRLSINSMISFLAYGTTNSLQAGICSAIILSQILHGYPSEKMCK